MNLTSVYRRPDRHILLYSLLAEREPTASISHKLMPTFGQHENFVEGAPYREWYFIEVGGAVVGACYLSRQDEIGIQIFKAHQGKGHGPRAVKMLMERHGPRRYLANVNPENSRSAEMFQRLGFNLCQHTYERI